MAPLLTRARTPSSRAGRGGTTAREKIPPGFPTGEGIRRALAGFFREQKRLALGNLDRLLATAKAGGPWDEAGLGADELAERLIPALGAIWDASGEGEADRANAVRARFGLPPIAWDPSSPEIAEAIAAHARTLAGNLQGVTEDQTLEALHAGSEAGESPEQLRDRLITLFRGMETARAERIARTEAIRAHHAAANLAATRSGVVAGWEWVAGGDACSLCREIAARCRYQRLGQPFAVVGGHADYASVPHPPAHPHCACTLAPVLLPEYGGPEDVAWGEPVEQAEEGQQPPEIAPRPRLAASRGPHGRLGPNPDPKRLERVIRDQARVARREGVKTIPYAESKDFLDLISDNPHEVANVIAIYDTTDDVIVLNPDNRIWQDIPGFMKENEGYFSTMHRHHQIRHEIGHAKHWNAMDGKQRNQVWLSSFDQKSKKIALRVSGRASVDQSEFVAEVYAGNWAGKVYDEEVLNLYRKLHGPPLRQ